MSSKNIHNRLPDEKEVESPTAISWKVKKERQRRFILWTIRHPVSLLRCAFMSIAEAYALWRKLVMFALATPV
jgi:hypothetical protein